MESFYCRCLLKYLLLIILLSLIQNMSPKKLFGIHSSTRPYYFRYAKIHSSS